MMIVVASLLHAPVPAILAGVCIVLLTGLIGVALHACHGSGPDENRSRIRRDFWGYD